MPVRRPPRIRPKQKAPARPWRAVALLAIVLATGAWCWPRLDQRQAATSNALVLLQLLARYQSDHQASCQNLGSLLAAESPSAVRLRNPYSGAMGGLDDPAIARPLNTFHGSPAEAGVVFYQVHPDALGRVCWTVRVADAHGALHAVPAAQP